MLPAAVECHSGYAYADRPAALHWQGQRLEIAEILARSRTPQGSQFRVRTAGGRTFELVYNEATGEWQAAEL